LVYKQGNGLGNRLVCDLKKVLHKSEAFLFFNRGKIHFPKARKKSEELMEQALGFIGIKKRQTLDTNNTLLHHIVGAKNTLLNVNRDNPEALSLWGFEVVSSRGMGGSKKKPA